MSAIVGLAMPSQIFRPGLVSLAGDCTIHPHRYYYDSKIVDACLRLFRDEGFQFS